MRRHGRRNTTETNPGRHGLEVSRRGSRRSILQQGLGLTIHTGITHKAHKTNQQRHEGKRHNIKGPENMRIR